MSAIEPTIAHLDFDAEPVMCECPACQMHIGQPCPKLATHCIRVHMFGECRNKDITPDGWVSQFVCRQCLFVRASKIGQLVYESQRVYHRMGRFLCCSGCQASIIRVNDFFTMRELPA